MECNYCCVQVNISELPSAKPTAIGGMTRAELDAELMKGIESIKNGKIYSVDEVNAELAEEFGI